MELTIQQKNVLDKIIEFLKSDASVFILRGYAGTGKTTMVKEIAEYISRIRTFALMAPTGRAARVLHEKTGFPAATIHKSIYGSVGIIVKNVTDIAESDFKYHFPINLAKENLVAIIDEASMLPSHKHEQELFEFGSDNLMDDLFTFIRPSFGGKVIFVGDPVQLPPVGESVSQALNAEFFISKGLKVMEAELTEVLRQGKNSVILENAMILRQLLAQNKRNKLVFKEKQGEVVSLPIGTVLPKYLKERKSSGTNNSVVICFSNKAASHYNLEIREALYGEENPKIRKGDILMVVQNNYRLDRMNGEFVPVLSVEETSSLSAPVYVQENGQKKRKTITLTFIQIQVTNGMGEIAKCQLLLDLLENATSSLSIDKQKALYINFCMRHPTLKQGSEEFIAALKVDPYYNCLKAKYGYAVTGHKCQGGEWANVFVDYSGRTGLSDDCLRWAYTATTRASKMLFIANLPHITPFAKFRIDRIQQCKKIDEEFRVIGKTEKSPFHSEVAPPFLLAKWMCVQRNLEFSPYRIDHIVSKPFIEIYYIQTPSGIERYDISYKKCGIFAKAVAQLSSDNSVLVGMMLDDERGMPLVFDYKPSDEIFENLYNLIKSICDGLNIMVTNVVEHVQDYYVAYYFRTSETASYIKIYVNNKGFITYAKPMSLIGEGDKELVMLIGEIQNHFE